MNRKKTEQDHHLELQPKLDAPRVCRWFQDKKAAFSVTIDDNFVEDHPTWCEWADEFGWKWTWFVITGQVDTGSTTGGTWQDWQKLCNEGHDIQSHTFTHLQPINPDISIRKDYQKSENMLNTHVKKENARTLAYPYGYSAYHKKEPCNEKKSPGCRNNEKQANAFYLAERGVIGSLVPQEKIDFSNVHSFSLNRRFFKTTPFIENTQCKNFQKFDNIFDTNEDHHFFGAWYCVHSHSIYPNGKNDKAVEKGIYEMLKYVSKKEEHIWVAPFTKVAQYGQERQAASIDSNHNQTKDDVDFKVTNFKVTLNNSLTKNKEGWFNHPLTIKVDLGASCELNLRAIAYSHEDKTTFLKCKIVKHSPHDYALIDIVPNAKWVTIKVPKG